MGFPLNPVHGQKYTNSEGKEFEFIESVVDTPEGTKVISIWKKPAIVVDTSGAIKISQQQSATPTEEVWVGTLIEYQDLVPDPNTLYFIKEI